MKTTFVGQFKVPSTSNGPKLRSTAWILGSDRHVPLPDYTFVRPTRTSRPRTLLRLIAEIQ